MFTLRPLPCECAPPLARGQGSLARSPMPIIRLAGCASQLPGPGCEVNDCTPSAPSAPEGPQHFAFPEISRENRGCLVLHSGNSRVSLSLREIFSNTKQLCVCESESWSGAKSEAKLRKSTKYPGGRRVISIQVYTVLRKIPGILPIWPKIWLADFGPKPASEPKI